MNDPIIEEVRRARAEIAARKRLEWLRTERLLGEWGVGEDHAGGRRQFEMGMEQRKEQEMSKESGDWRKLRRGWCWGPNSFREELLEQIGAKKGAAHHGEELWESDEQKAQRMVAGMLREVGWKESELGRRLKGDVKKGRMAARLRAETTTCLPCLRALTHRQAAGR